MLDVETYLLTKDSPGGPIVQFKPWPTEEWVGTAPTAGVAIGRAIGFVIVLALGAYLALGV